MKEAACSIHLKKNKLTYTQPKSKRQMFEYVKTQRNKTFKKKDYYSFTNSPVPDLGSQWASNNKRGSKTRFASPRVMWNRSCRSLVGAPPNHFPNMIRVVCSSGGLRIEQWTLWRSYHVQNLRRCSTEVMSHYTSIPKSLPSNLLSSMLHLILGSNTIVSLC